MVFSSLLFIFLFFAVVLTVYYCLPKKFRNGLLFVANLVFYGYGEPIFVLLMLFSVALNYASGLLLGKFAENKKAKQIILLLNVIANLGLLGYFKYAGFAAAMLQKIPVFAGIAIPNIALPIGISFYTFQTMSYVIDVYRGDCAVQKSFIAFGTYVSLFPQLIAGPIVRYKDVDEQLVSRQESLEEFDKGVKIFLVGLAKKVLIANRMGILWDTLRVDEEAGMVAAWVGIIAYSLQIYFDFSGYSDMAIGLGHMFGFEFLKNFDYPYISKSITEFWRRWHISLGTWFREYVYIPLGGNRKGKVRQILNIFIVWALTGLWHGASWNFVFWGVYFGILLMIEKLFLLKFLKKIPAVFTHIYTLFLVVISWIFFYFETTDGIFSFMGRLFSLSDGLLSQDAAATVVANLPLLLIAFVACTPLAKKVHHKLEGKPFMPVVDAIAGVASLLLSVGALVYDSYNPFLYFRF
ncbi:MAG: MBOAT family protein [Clostridia bacterium]|nr:MBOAT family protein [Clostridia bacterium]MBR2413284.1 MBOAT family protein [Clostridia bacterium]